MSLLRFPRASFVLNPAFLALVTWIMVTFLYSLHLSSLLLFSTGEAFTAALLIVGPILLVSLIFKIAYSVNTTPTLRTVVVDDVPIARLESRVNQGFKLWIVLAVIETITSGGVPLVWLITANGKANWDYGISSVHGMVNALLLALAVASFALYLYAGKKSHLVLPLFAVVWSFILVSRGTLFVLAAECIIIYLRLRKVRWTSVVRLAVLAVAMLFVFGYVGDFRSGAEAFRDLAKPTPDFPDWAPSGLLWAYIYITTPMNNLLYTMHTIHPIYNPLLPNTAATLFPTVLRNLIYGKEGAVDAISGSRVVDALNVSTAYVSPFQDMGRLGMIGFSTLSATLCETFWRRNGFRNLFFFAVFTQALILSLFYNLLFALPILGQLVWFIYFTQKPALTIRDLAHE